MVCEVPELSRFLGLLIKMPYLDHGKPHFHVFYGSAHRGQGNKSAPAAKIQIVDGKVIAGYLPKPQLSIVLAWMYLHQTELLAAWDRAVQGLSLPKIAPLKK